MAIKDFLVIFSFRGSLAPSKVEELVVLKENRKLLKAFKRNSEYKIAEGVQQNPFGLVEAIVEEERARLTMLRAKRSSTSSMMIWRRSGWRRRRSTDFLLST